MTPPKGQYFRAGAGAVIVDAAGNVLALERAHIAGAWQLPQGGLDAGEEPFDAVLREVKEETGLASRELELLGQFPELLAYELPAADRSAKTGRGQVHHWFVFRYRGRGKIELPKDGEFTRWQWMPFPQLIAGAVGFWQPIYAKLSRYVEQLEPAGPRK